MSLPHINYKSSKAVLISLEPCHGVYIDSFSDVILLNTCLKSNCHDVNIVVVLMGLHFNSRAGHCGWGFLHYWVSLLDNCHRITPVQLTWAGCAFTNFLYLIYYVSKTSQSMDISSESEDATFVFPTVFAAEGEHYRNSGQEVF